MRIFLNKDLVNVPILIDNSQNSEQEAAKLLSTKRDTFILNLSGFSGQLIKFRQTYLIQETMTLSISSHFL